MKTSHTEALVPRRSLWHAIVLPAAISDFERKYLARMTRVALWFFAAHVPAMMAVAALAGTGVLKAALFTTFLLLGPLLATRVLPNPRHVTKVIAVASMCLAGLLVHFGQGTMQIEMHFYFFVLLALLVVFADPMVIVVAAATVSAHHALLFVLLPQSIFNHDATLWTVVVHAAFVVVESVAACFVARSFFGSVIGLEQKVQRRTSQLEARSTELRLMLDTVDQGFLTLDRHGVVQGERSKILDQWLPPCPPGAFAWDYLGAAQPKVARAFQLGWGEVVDDVMPLDLCLDQLPKRIQVEGRPIEIAYHPLLEGGALAHVVVVLSDVSGRVEQERVEEENADLLAVCERIAHDRSGFREYLAESDHIVTGLQDPDIADRTKRRLVHTLKGNSALFGLGAIARLCHAYEDAMDESESLSEIARSVLLARWAQFRAKLSVLFGTRDASTFEISEADLQALQQALVSGHRDEALQRLARLRLEPVSARFARLAEQAQLLAGKLGKAPLVLDVQAGDVRLDRAPWAPLWSALVHVVHNAVDHGLETEAERLERSKPRFATLSFAAREHAGELVLSFADDGRGIDWAALRERAESMDLPAETQADLEAALFASGVSTKRETTTLSGRGVGLGALRGVVRRMGGTISVRSTTGEGTRFELRIPHDQAQPASKLVA